MRMWRRFAANRLALAGLISLALLVLLAALAGPISPQDPYDLAQLDILNGRLPPGAVGGDGQIFWLGTDEQGRDILSAILHGLRVSLFVGGATALIAGLIGSILGLAAGYLEGLPETLIMRLVDLQLSLPAILVALIVLALTGRGVLHVVLALVIVEWAVYARTAHAAARSECQRDYIAAAECVASPRWRIVMRHLLPNCLPPLSVIATFQLARAIMLEATLSFLGVGVQSTEPSLGMLIAEGSQFMLSGRYWMSVYPGMALLLAMFSVNLVGDRLRDALNPHLDE